MRRAALRVPEPKDTYYPFEGGLDQETPPWNLKKGRLVEALNYELGIHGGYQDIVGYERFDGRPAPSDASYNYILVNLTGSFSVGDTVTGLTSGATGVVAQVVTDPADALVLTQYAGVFVTGEDLQVAAVTQGTAAQASEVEGALTTQAHAIALAGAADVFRGDIAEVPGTGPVRGVFVLSNEVYAFRDVDGSSSALYRATAGGWTLVPLGNELGFTSGSYDFQVGDTITGATSGATAVITQVAEQTGTSGSGDLEGRLIYASQTGTFQAENLDVGANLDVATIAGDGAPITMLPGGSFELYASNFDGRLSQDAIYGCDGVNRGFEFDGTTFTPVVTGMPTDAPEHVIVHRQHLFFSFGPSVQYSGIGEPFRWTLLFGANELRTDSQVTGFKREPGAQGNASLGVYNRNRLHILYGTSSADFELVPYRDEVGAYAGTIQQLAYTLFMDDRGITSLKAVQEFGNFNHATLSTRIQTFIKKRRGLAISSCIVREKNQYRIFFSDLTALYITMEGTKVVAMMPVELDHQVVCIYSAEQSDGLERIFFGSTDGFVREMERGTSFDGNNIDAFFQTHYTNDGIRQNKKYLSPVTVESRGQGYAEVAFSYSLGYGDAEEVPQPNERTREIEFSASSAWDEPGRVWDELFWDGRSLVPTSGLELRGTAENVSFIFRKDSNYMQPVRLTGVHYRHLPRKGKR